MLVQVQDGTVLYLTFAPDATLLSFRETQLQYNVQDVWIEGSD